MVPGVALCQAAVPITTVASASIKALQDQREGFTDNIQATPARSAASRSVMADS